jgi:hypothetical protein
MINSVIVSVCLSDDMCLFCLLCCLSVYFSYYMCLCLFNCLCFCFLSLYDCTGTSSYPFSYLSACLSIPLPVRLHVCQSCLSFLFCLHLSVCSSNFVTNCLSVSGYACLSLHLPFIPFVFISKCLSLFSSIFFLSMSVCLSICIFIL